MTLAMVLSCPVCAASGSAHLGALLPLLLLVPYLASWAVVRAVRSLDGKRYGR